MIIVMVREKMETACTSWRMATSRSSSAATTASRRRSVQVNIGMKKVTTFVYLHFMYFVNNLVR